MPWWWRSQGRKLFCPPRRSWQITWGNSLTRQVAAEEQREGGKESYWKAKPEKEGWTSVDLPALLSFFFLMPSFLAFSLCPWPVLLSGCILFLFVSRSGAVLQCLLALMTCFLPDSPPSFALLSLCFPLSFPLLVLLFFYVFCRVFLSGVVSLCLLALTGSPPHPPPSERRSRCGSVDYSNKRAIYKRSKSRGSSMGCRRREMTLRGGMEGERKEVAVWASQLQQQTHHIDCQDQGKIEW